MNKGISVAEAKATFSECIRKVESGVSLLITRHGKSVAALVSADDLEHLERLRKAGPELLFQNSVGFDSAVIQTG